MHINVISTYKGAAIYHIVDLEPLSSKDLNRLTGLKRIRPGKLGRASLKRVRALRHDALCLGKKSFKAINSKLTSICRARAARSYDIQDISTEREWIKDGKNIRRQFRKESKGLQRELVEKQRAVARKLDVEVFLQGLAGEVYGPKSTFDGRELQHYRDCANAKGNDALMALFKQDVTDILSKDLKEASEKGGAPLVTAILASRSSGAAGLEGNSFEDTVHQAALALMKTAAWDLALKLGEVNQEMTRHDSLVKFRAPSFAAAAA